jgi:hypothetical protein
MTALVRLIATELHWPIDQDSFPSTLWDSKYFKPPTFSASQSHGHIVRVVVHAKSQQFSLHLPNIFSFTLASYTLQSSSSKDLNLLKWIIRPMLSMISKLPVLKVLPLRGVSLPSQLHPQLWRIAPWRGTRSWIFMSTRRSRWWRGITSPTSMMSDGFQGFFFALLLL